MLRPLSICLGILLLQSLWRAKALPHACRPSWAQTDGWTSLQSDNRTFYLTKELIGHGSSGTHAVFRAKMLFGDKRTREVALKVERPINGSSQIRREAAIYQLLSILHSTKGELDERDALFTSSVSLNENLSQPQSVLPCFHVYLLPDNAGTFLQPVDCIESDHYHYLVLPLCYHTLEDVVRNSKHGLCMHVALEIVLHLLTQLQKLHAAGFVHGDIKPGNICKINDMSFNYTFIDFGLSRAFIDVRTGYHLPKQTRQRKMTTNALFASRHAHQGFRQSRRDDLESLSYLMILLLKGTLPWQHLLNVKFQDLPYTEVNTIVGKMKAEISTARLCSGLPIQISNFVTKIKKLGFYEVPDYDALRREILDFVSSV